MEVQTILVFGLPLLKSHCCRKVFVPLSSGNRCFAVGLFTRRDKCSLRSSAQRDGGGGTVGRGEGIDKCSQVKMFQDICLLPWASDVENPTRDIRHMTTICQYAIFKMLQYSFPPLPHAPYHFLNSSYVNFEVNSTARKNSLLDDKSNYCPLSYVHVPSSREKPNNNPKEDKQPSV